MYVRTTLSNTSAITTRNTTGYQSKNRIDRDGLNSEDNCDEEVDDGPTDERNQREQASDDGPGVRPTESRAYRVRRR